MVLDEGGTTHAQNKIGAEAVQTRASQRPMADVLTLSEAAVYLRVPEPEVLWLVREQGLPVRQVGLEWHFPWPPSAIG